MFAQDEKLANNSYYTATAQPLAEQPSLQGAMHADVCVVGAGLAGLSTALELANAGFQVVLLEAKRVAWAASGRNGGQAIAGYACGEEPFEKVMSMDEAKRAFNLTIEGLDLMRERIRQYHIDCDLVDGYMTASVKPKSTAGLFEWADRMSEVYDYPYLQKISAAEMPDWVASKRYHSGVLDKNSAHLHPLKYALGVARAALNAGVQIFEHSLVTQIDYSDPAVVKTAQGQVTAKFVVLAGNVYIDELVPKIAKRIMPVGTYIIATERLPKETADSLIIELNNHSKAILDKYKEVHFEYDKVLPVITNQKMNDYLKELAELAEINEPIREVYYKGNKRIDEVTPKYALLGTHAGRRTFICNALSLGIPAQVVMKWTGHSDYKAMKPYIDIADEIKANAMDKFNQL